jgi:hypothetical protein
MSAAARAETTKRRLTIHYSEVIGLDGSGDVILGNSFELVDEDAPKDRPHMDVLQEIIDAEYAQSNVKRLYVVTEVNQS